MLLINEYGVVYYIYSLNAKKNCCRTTTSLQINENKCKN